MTQPQTQSTHGPNGTASSNSAGQEPLTVRAAAASTKAKAVEAKDKAGDQADKIRNDVNETAQRIVRLAKDKSLEAVESAKSGVAGEIQTVSQALTDAATTLSKENSPASEPTRKLAMAASQASQSLKQKSVVDIFDDVNDTARAHPALFLGGAVALGFAAARFFTSTDRR